MCWWYREPVCLHNFLLLTKIKQAVPINGDNIPPLWSVPTPSRNTQQIVLFFFRSIFGHQRAKNEGTNTKIDRGPEIYPISINPRDEMNRADSFRENCGNPDFRSIFGHQRAKNAGTNTKIDRGPETYPISINRRDEMNWANSFREKLRKPCLQTDGRTDGRTDRRTDGRTDRHQGESSIPPFHLRWSGGIIIVTRSPSHWLPLLYKKPWVSQFSTLSMFLSCQRDWLFQ